MAISKDLFLAILSMDAYNRGYNPGINLGTTSDSSGIKVGNATIFARSSSEVDSQAVAAGFYAIAYDMTGVSNFTAGEKVISYRGTDGLGLDLLSYPLALGNYTTEQVRLAAQFYLSIAGAAGINHVSLTGHSLGGGLAGFISGLYGSRASIFDNMPFELGLATFLADMQLGLNTAFRNNFTQGGISPSPNAARGNIGGYYVEGEFLGAARAATFQQNSLAPINLGPDIDLPGLKPDNGVLGGNLHSMSLLVIGQFGNSPGLSLNWKNASKFFIPQLFGDALATLTGANALAVGDTPFSEAMRTAIAYSAIDEGTRVFGDTGIRALFNDANELGEALAAASSSARLRDYGSALSEMFVQYAGQLAVRKILQSASPQALNGILTLSPDKKTLSVDFSDALWSLGGAKPAVIVGRDTILAQSLSQASGALDGARDAMQWLWNTNSTDLIDRIVIASKDDAQPTTLTPRSGAATITPSNGAVPVTFAAFGDGNDTITGSTDNELIDGGAGNDILKGGAGRDWIVGGDGNDTLVGGLGNDVLIGGAGIDTVDYTQDIPGGSAANVTLRRISGAVPALEITGPASAGTDRFFSVERVNLTAMADRIAMTEKVTGPLGFNVVFDGKSAPAGGTGYAIMADVLDFSGYSGPAYIYFALTNSASDAPGPTPAQYAVELYTNYSPIVAWGQWIFNVFVASGATSGEGVYGGTGLRFTNFEYVKGSAYGDVLGLRSLSPGGALTPAQTDQLNAARHSVITFNSGIPATIGALSDERMEQARLVPQNQQDVLIEAGAGNDVVIGTRTGADRIYGGTGDDKLYAGGFTSVIYGEAGNDTLTGGGFKTNLYGGAGSDTFNLAHHTFVMDAAPEDYINWGPMRLTGGVQQWWMESGWAYYTPFTSIIGAAGWPALVGGGILLTIGTLLDVGPMTTARYAVTETKQLVVQTTFGGQAVIDNWGSQFDPATGATAGHVTVFRQDFALSGKGSIQNFLNYMKLAIKAGFGFDVPGIDPLILDLDKDGVELSRLDSSNVYFDLDNDGFAERTAWVGADDGLLARDLNSNNKIDNISELFGTATAAGFSQLATLDSNVDGKITSADTAFSSLRIWKDLNQNGVTDPGELKTLAKSGITQISVSNSAPTTTDIRGNTIRAQSTFTFSNGTTSQIVDAVLDVAPADTQYLGNSTVSPAAAALPQLKGFGDVANLGIAMTNDPTLLGLVTSFKNLPAATNWAGLRNAADDILYRWTGADQVTALAMTNNFDERKLAVLEKLSGTQLAPRDGNGRPFVIGVNELVSMWNETLDNLTVRLAAQSALKPTLGNIAFDLNADRFFATSPAAIADILKNAILQLPALANDALAQWNSNWGPLLQAYSEALVRHDGNNVKPDYLVQALVQALDTTSPSLSLSQLASGLGITNLQVGTSGSDALARSGSGLAIYVGGAGNDTITGGKGQDVYIYGRGFGQDTIIDAEGGIGMQSGDRIRLALYNPADVTIKNSGADLVISVNATADKITIKNQFETPIMTTFGQISPSWGIEDIQFKDGTIFEAQDIARLIGQGTDASETLSGTPMNDILEARKGDDLVQGAGGSDTYIYRRGDGADVIQDVPDSPLNRGSDILYLAGLNDDDITLARAGKGTDVTLSFTGGGSIVIKDQFYYNALGYSTTYASDSRMEAIFFNDGTGWGWQDLQAATIATYTTSGNDVTYGFGTDDQFYVSAGNDYISGLDGGDTYRFGAGAGKDIVEDASQYLDSFISGLVGYSWGADDTLIFGEGVTISNVTFTRPSQRDLVISINGTLDQLTLKDEYWGQKLDLFNLLPIAWFSRVENFKFSDGMVFTWDQILDRINAGSTGDDTLYGAWRPDTLDGRGGNDFLDGSDDGDTYLFGRGDGQDIIFDQPNYVIWPAEDTLQFKSGVAIADVKFTRDGETNDLIVSIVGTTDKIRIKEQYQVAETGVFGAQAFHQIENFKWADGTVKTWTSIAQQIIDEAKTPGNDLIVGSHFNDRLDGGLGNDTLKGGDGADRYVYNLGYGNDTIKDLNDNILAEDGDIVQFGAGITPSNITLQRSGTQLNDLTFGFSDGGSLKIEGQFFYSTIDYRMFEIENFAFANGVNWTAADLRAAYIQQHQTAGNDTIDGFYTSDTINGGTGNDVLRGGDGSDIYKFGLGFGQDRIEETVINVIYNDNDSVEFLAGLTSTNALFSRIGNDLIIGFSSLTDLVTIAGQFTHLAGYPGWHDVESFRFADGVTLSDAQVRDRLILQAKTAGNDVIEGFFGADRLDGGAGNDILRGRGGGDSYVFGKGSGQDTIEDSYDTVYEDQADTVEFATNVLASEVSYNRVGNDLIITIAATTDSLTIKNQFLASGTALVEQFKYADGSLLTAAQVAAGTLIPLNINGNNTIVGTSAAEVLDGGPGNDMLTDELGGDTYIFGRGYGQDVINEQATGNGQGGDKVSFKAGVSLSDLLLSRSGNDMVISISGTTDQLTIKNQFWYSTTDSFYNPDRIESFAFANGAVLSGSEMDILLLAQTSTAGNDIVRAYPDSADVLDGGAGNDTLAGETGADTYVFGRGSGQDVIDEHSDAANGDSGDKVAFKPGITFDDLRLSRTGDDLVIQIASTTDQLTVKNQFWYSTTNSFFNMDRVESFVFADGSIVSSADMDLRLLAQTSTAGNDTIIAYPDSADVIDGGAGNDFMQGSTGADTYLFGRGSGQDIIDEQNGSNGQSGDKVSFKAGVALTDILLSRFGDDLIIRINGTSDQLTIKNQFYYSTTDSFLNNDRIESFTFADSTVLTGGDMDIRLLSVTSTAGNDTVIAYPDSADVIDGGAGNDLLQGLTGADTYLFGRDSGLDVIDEQNGSNGQSGDRVVFKTGVALSDLLLSRSGNDLVIRITGTADQLTIKNQFYYSVADSFLNNDRIESFVFADGAVVAASVFDQDLLTQAATGSNDTIRAYPDSADTLDGLAGNDVMTGETGADTYIFGRGYGQDTIDETIGGGGGSNSADRLLFKAGIAFSDLILFRTGNDLVIGIAGTADQLTIKNQFYLQDSFLNADLIESFVFADGASLTATQMAAQALAAQGTNGNDTITGYETNDILSGGNGDDVLIGGAGSDVMDGGAGNDTVRYTKYSTTVDLSNLANNSGDAAGDTYFGIERFEFTSAGVRFVGSSGNDYVVSNWSDDTLIGGAGNDYLDGGAGSDTMTGNAGDDTYVVGSSGDIVTEALNEGLDTVQASIAYTLGTNFENLVLTGTAAIAGTGNTLNNTLDGSRNSGANVLTGGTGDDFYILGVGDTVIEAAASGIDTVQSAISATLSANVENLTLTGASAISGTGNTLDNIIDGSQNSAANALAGGAGNDTYIVGAGDTVAEAVNEGTDVVRSSVSFVLGANIENLILTGSGALNGSGNALNNSLAGNSSNNTLDGGIGADIMAGGAGNDVYVVDNIGDAVTENAGAGTDTVRSSIAYTLGANVENLVLAGAAAITATGNALNNTLDGSGNTAVNALAGGTGDDTYILGTGDTVTEAASAGTDTVYASFAYTLGVNVENLVLTGSAAIAGTGNTLANTLTGNSAANTLDGGTGADTMIGGAGNDTYVVDSTSDIVTEALNEGVDLILSSVTIAALATNIENLTLTGTAALNGTGNGSANAITGNSGANVLSGAAGADRLDGGAAGDTLTGGADNDLFVFRTGYGKDVITDFVAGAGVVDAVEFSLGSSFDSYSEIMTAAAQVGLDTVITIDANTSLTLKNIAKTALVADDFLFI